VVSSIFTRIKYRYSKDNAFYKYLKNVLGFTPKKIELYRIAFIHKSASLRLTDGSWINNERLEYLGDAVLDAIVADYLFNIFPEKDEGFLTKMRSKLVNRVQLDMLADKIRLKDFIVSQTHNVKNKHIYGNAFEALIGAAYLDRGYDITKRFFLIRLLNKYIDLRALENTETDYKSRVIEWGQKYKIKIDFAVEELFDSATKSNFFYATVLRNGDVIGEGKGSSKKEASQYASRQALKQLSKQ